MTETTLNRNDEIQQIHKDYPGTYRIVTSIFFILVGVAIGPTILGNSDGYNTNIYTEIISIAITVLILNYLQERRDNRNRIKDLQDQLVRDAGSRLNAISLTAIERLSKYGWLGRKNLYDLPDDSESLLRNSNLYYSDLSGAKELRGANLSGSNFQWSIMHNVDLYGADLKHSNLKNAELNDSNLMGALLNKANLSNTNLSNADLRATTLELADLSFSTVLDANLSQSNLCGVNMLGVKSGKINLSKADLRGAYMQWADLSNSDLSEADLSGADLIHADLRGTDLTKSVLNGLLIQATTKFDERTFLPDYTRWSPNVDLTKFGVEMRPIIDARYISDEYTGDVIYTVWTFTDGVTRRWQRGKGWLDDRDGNPLPS